MQFNACGRLIVTTRMWGDGKVRMRLFMGGGGVWNIFGQVLYREAVCGLRWYERRFGDGNAVETPIGPSGTGTGMSSGLPPLARVGAFLFLSLAIITSSPFAVFFAPSPQ